MGLLSQIRHLRRLLGGVRRDEPAPHEMELFAEFSNMNLNEVRKRAEEFESAIATLEGRAVARETPSSPSSGQGFVPEVLYGQPAESWRALETHLRDEGRWQVSEMERIEQLRWARRTRALSRAFARPTLIVAGEPQSQRQRQPPR